MGDPIRALLPFRFRLVSTFLFLFYLLARGNRFPGFLFPCLFRCFVRLLACNFLALSNARVRNVRLNIFPIARALGNASHLFFRRFVLTISIIGTYDRRNRLLFRRLLIGRDFKLHVRPFPCVVGVLQFMPFFSLPYYFRVFILRFSRSRRSIALALGFPKGFFRLTFLLYRFFRRLFFLFLREERCFPHYPGDMVRFSNRYANLLLRVVRFPVGFGRPINLPTSDCLAILVFPRPLASINRFFVRPTRVVNVLPRVSARVFFIRERSGNLLSGLYVGF